MFLTIQAKRSSPLRRQKLLRPDDTPLTNRERQALMIHIEREMMAAFERFATLHNDPFEELDIIATKYTLRHL